jgi:hypothetical protein
VLYVPTYSLPRLAAKFLRAVQLDRELQKEAELQTLVQGGAKEQPLRLLQAVDASHSSAINNAVRVY